MKKIFKQFSILTLSTGLAQLAAMLSTIRVARGLSPEVYGQLGIFISLVAIAQTISGLGLRQVVIRHIARNKGNCKNVFYVSLVSRTLGAVITAILFLIYRYFTSYDESFYTLLLIMSLFSLNLWESIENLSFGQHKIQASGIIGMIFSFIYLVYIFVLPAEMITLTVIFSSQIAVQYLKDIVLWIYIKRQKLIKGDNPTKISQEVILNLLKEGRIYYAVALMGLFISQIPIIFLDAHTSSTEVGYFNVANKLLLPLGLIINSCITTVFPYLAAKYTEDREAFIRQVKLIFNLMALVAIVSSSVFSIFRQELVDFLFGEAYKSTGYVLTFQCWFFVINAGLLTLLSNVLGAINKDSFIGLLTFVGAFISIPLFWITSYYGAEVLSIAYLAFAFIQFIICPYFLCKALNFEIKYRYFIKISAFIVLGIAVSSLLPVFLSFAYRTLFIFLSLFLLLFVKREAVLAYFKRGN